MSLMEARVCDHDPEAHGDFADSVADLQKPSECGVLLRCNVRRVRCAFPQKQTGESGWILLFVGAGNGNRTRTVKPHAPQTCASASSATPAERYSLYTILSDLSIPFLKKIQKKLNPVKEGQIRIKKSGQM